MAEPHPAPPRARRVRSWRRSAPAPPKHHAPRRTLEERYHIYESNPAPWWIGLLWASYLIFGVTYLIVNLIE